MHSTIRHLSVSLTLCLILAQAWHRTKPVETDCPVAQQDGFADQTPTAKEGICEVHGVRMDKTKHRYDFSVCKDFHAVIESTGAWEESKLNYPHSSIRKLKKNKRPCDKRGLRKFTAEDEGYRCPACLQARSVWLMLIGPRID